MAKDGQDSQRFPGTPESRDDRVPAYAVMQTAAGGPVHVPAETRGSAAEARAWLHGWADLQEPPIAGDTARWLATGSDQAVLEAIADLGRRWDPQPISDATKERITVLQAAASAAHSELLAMTLLALAEQPTRAKLWTEPGAEWKTCGTFGSLRLHVSERATKNGPVIDEVTFMVAGSDWLWYTRPTLGGGDQQLLALGRAARDVARDFAGAFKGDPVAVHQVCSLVVGAIRETVLNAPTSGRTVSGDGALNVGVAAKAFAVWFGAAAFPWEVTADQLAVPEVPSDASYWQRIVAGVFPNATWHQRVADGGRVLRVPIGHVAITVAGDGSLQRHEGRSRPARPV